MDKKWGSAGSAYIEAALLHGKSGNRHDAATNYVDASHCFKKSDLNGLYHILFTNFITTLLHFLRSLFNRFFICINQMQLFETG